MVQKKSADKKVPLNNIMYKNVNINNISTLSTVYKYQYKHFKY